MHISLTKRGNSPKSYMNKGTYYKSGIPPYEWFISKNNKTEDKYTPDFCALKYDKQKYLYVFIFYDFSRTSVLRSTFFKQISEDDVVCFYDGNHCAVLSNNKITACKYDYESECLISDDNEMLDSDDIGGDLCYANLTIKNTK